MMSEERNRELLMRVVDGIATDEERAKLERLVASDQTLKDEYTAMMKIKEVTDQMQYREMPDSFWADYWNGVYRRLERGVGWSLLVIGVALLAGFGIFELFRSFFLNSSISIVLRGGLFVALLGSLVLLASIIREVFFARKRERYKEIQR
jgi:hypothetical protein